MTEPKNETFIFTGGVDLQTPDIAMAPGRMKGCMNVEQRAGVDGFWRVDGIESTDGHPLASDAGYNVYVMATGTGTAANGDSFTGGVSGAVIKTLGVYDFTTASHIYVYVISGTAVVGEAFVGPSGNFTASSVTITGTSVESEIIDYTKKAQALARGAISAPAGSGRLRGVFTLKGTDYCLRDNSAGTECILYEESSSGWTAVTMGFLIEFNGNTNEPLVGETLTQGADNGAITAVVKQTGGWGTSDAVGYVVLSPHTGTFGAGAATTATASITLTGAGTAITLSPGGRYEVKVHNYYGNVADIKAYWVDGVNRAFEFDGNVPTPIHVNNLTSTQDKPTHLDNHQFRLITGYPAGSAQISSIGTPKVFDVITAATYYDPGDAVTGLWSTAGNSLAIFCESSIYLMQGPEDPWTFTKFTQDTGAVPYSIQGWRDIYFVDGSDILSLATTQAFGDFKQNIISSPIKSWLAQGKTVTASAIIKKKGQYRLFFDDATGCTLTFDRNKVSGFTFFEYPTAINCVWVEDDRILAGGFDGMVYLLDSGNSFNGEKINGFVRSPYYSYGNPRIEDQFLKAIVNFRSGTYLTTETELKLIPEFDYGREEMALGYEGDIEIQSGGGYWDQNSYYGSFYWDADVASDIEVEIEGAGVNMSLIFDFESDYDDSFMIHSVTVEYIPLYYKP